MRALGATPVHVSGDGVADAVANGEIDGAEASLGSNSTEEGETHLTANLPLFPKTLTLFAGDGAYNRLDEDQREVHQQGCSDDRGVRRRARALRDGVDAQLLQRRPARERGRGERRRRRRARERRPARLHAARAGSGHKAAIGAIRALKAASPAAPASAPPAACGTKASTASGGERSPSSVNGTYHWRVTEPGARAAARAVGGSPHQRTWAPWAR